MNFIDQAIVITLGSVALKYKKPYCFPSQDHICRLLKWHHGIQISRRSLNRHLAILELDGFFDRTKRHRRGENAKILFNTTLYRLRKKFFKFVGFLKDEAQKFGAFFRVPSSAQYRVKPSQGSPVSTPDCRSGSGKTGKEGGPSGTSSGNLFVAALEGLRGLLKSPAFGS